LERDLFKTYKENHSEKRALVAHPPRRKSAELCGIADGRFAISEQKLKRNQLPEKIVTLHGGTRIHPTE